MTTNLAELAAEPAEARMRLQGLIERVRSEREKEVEPVVGPYLALSREAESGGAEVASRVARLIGWQVLDRELVQKLSEALELEPRLLELMDETRVNWFSETLLNLFNSRIILQDSYVSMMSRVMALAAYDGPVIIVGRGGHLVLPPESGLRVRVVAPHQLRVQALAQREGLDERTAGHRLAAIDRSRTDFVRRHFHSDLAEAEKFDLVVNTGTFGLTGAAELIRRALEMRGFIE